MTPAASRRRTLLSVAMGLVLTSSLACENFESPEAQADRQVKKDADAGAALRKAPTTQSLNSALTELNKAAANGAASHTSRIRARTLQGQTEYDLGRRADAEIRLLQPTIEHLLWEIGQDALRVHQINQSIAALKATEPTITSKAVAAKRGEMEGLGQAAGTEAADLTGKIKAINDQVAAWQAEKDAAITAADADADKATKATGQEASELLDKAAESRRKAGNLGHQITKIQEGILPLQGDLAAAQARKKAADAAVADLDVMKNGGPAGADASKVKIKGFEPDWAETQARIAEQQTAAKTTGEALAARAKALDDLNTKADALRKSAAEHYAGSSKAYAAATDDANKLAIDINKWNTIENYKNSVERKAWDHLKEVYGPDVFRLSDAEARYALGQLHADHAALLQAHQKVAAAIAEPIRTAGGTPPTNLTDLTAAQAKATGDSNKAFTESADLFLKVHSPGATLIGVEQAGKVSRMYSLFGQYLNGGDDKKLDDAQAAFKAAFPGDKAKTDPLAKLTPDKIRG